MSGPVITLIRHGETEWTLTGQHTSITELPLTQHGQEEARRLWPSLQDTAFTQVLSSPRLRARQTCQLAGLGERSTLETCLAEWEYGEYEGLRSADIHRARPDWNIFRDGCPGGETPGDVVQRADRLIVRLRAQGGKIALFSHGHFSQVFAARWIGWPVEEGEHFTLDPASLSVLGTRPGTQSTPAILKWNCSAT